MGEYLPRVVDEELDLRMTAFRATLIIGSKWCGKTTTGEQKAKSIPRMQDRTNEKDTLLRLLPNHRSS